MWVLLLGSDIVLIEGKKGKGRAEGATKRSDLGLAFDWIPGQGNIEIGLNYFSTLATRPP